MATYHVLLTTYDLLRTNFLLTTATTTTTTTVTNIASTVASANGFAWIAIYWLHIGVYSLGCMLRGVDQEPGAGAEAQVRRPDVEKDRSWRSESRASHARRSD